MLHLHMESAQQYSDKSASVQHVNRKCSDELLGKFSDDSGDWNVPELASAPNRRKWISRSRVGLGAAVESCDSSIHGHGKGGSLVDRRSLSLLPAAAKRRLVLLRQLGIGIRGTGLSWEPLRRFSRRKIGIKLSF
ncbi:hypothetical protein SAY86_015430 [Trapa natans]|uniref:Uncharacterized protein n=1 Tax=Trapa natans TaxID=22666 RepID=A0AAN7KQC4_TRANT|nr:hypothetical protein SAY86_015430 [Trapa natans]